MKTLPLERTWLWATICRIGGVVLLVLGPAWIASAMRSGANKDASSVGSGQLIAAIARGELLSAFVGFVLILVGLLAVNLWVMRWHEHRVKSVDKALLLVLGLFVSLAPLRAGELRISAEVRDEKNAPKEFVARMDEAEIESMEDGAHNVRGILALWAVSDYVDVGRPVSSESAVEALRDSGCPPELAESLKEKVAASGKFPKFDVMRFSISVVVPKGGSAELLPDIEPAKKFGREYFVTFGGDEQAGVGAAIGGSIGARAATAGAANIGSGLGAGLRVGAELGGSL